MKHRCLFAFAIIPVVLALHCGKPEEERAVLDESALVRARVAMHANRVCAGGPAGAETVLGDLRLKRLTIENATLQTFPDPLGPTLNAGGPLSDYCWWVMGSDCPVSWYGDEKLDFPDRSAIQQAVGAQDLENRCRKWLEDEAGIDVDDVIAVSLYQSDWETMGFEGYDDGAYPVYVGLIPKDLLGSVNQADVTRCTFTVLAATEGGDSNTVFVYVTAIEFEA
jgi:hypothetical protein